MRALNRSTGLDRHVDASALIAQANVAQQLLATDQDRHYLFIQNVDSVDLWVDYGKAAVLDWPSILLSPGDNLTEEGNFVSGETVSIISSKVGHKVVCRTGGGVP